MCALVTGVQTCALPISRQLGMHVVQQLLAAHAQLRSPVATPVGDRVAAIQLDPAFLHAMHDAVRAKPMCERLRDALLGLGGNHATAIEYVRGRRPQFGHDAELLERSEEPTSELQSLMRISYAVLCLKKKKKT